MTKKRKKTAKVEIITAEGSYGTLEVDAKTGEVIALLDGPYETRVTPAEMKKRYEEGDTEGYCDIVKLDLDEWRAYCAIHHPKHDLDTDDILMFGFWNCEGKYFEPDHDWRKQMLEEAA
jgi:hypothetical protein